MAASKKINLVDKFKKLPPAAKVGIGVGVGAILFLVFRPKKTESSSTMRDDPVYYYSDGTTPGMMYDLSGAGGASYYTGGGSSSGSSGSGSGGVTSTQLDKWMDTLVSAINNNSVLGGPGADTQSGALDTAMAPRIVTVTEGQHTYQTTYKYDGSREILKNGRLIPENDWQYIPAAAGGTRIDTPAAAQRQPLDVTPYINDLDYQLQQAQAQWGQANAANDRAGMDAATALGQQLRGQGATDEGAQAAWQALAGK